MFWLNKTVSLNATTANVLSKMSGFVETNVAAKCSEISEFCLSPLFGSCLVGCVAKKMTGNIPVPWVILQPSDIFTETLAHFLKYIFFFPATRAARCPENTFCLVKWNQTAVSHMAAHLAGFPYVVLVS